MTDQQRDLVTALLDVATEAQADALDDLLVAAGYWAVCGCGAFAETGAPCDNCGEQA